MSQNIVVSLFGVESEAYQTFTELKQNPGNETSYVASAILVKKENGNITMLDGFDTGANTADDMVVGGLVGSLVGILGGPIGVLLGGSYGALIGSMFDTEDALTTVCLLEQIAGKAVDGDIGIIGLAFEEDESVLDGKLGKYNPTIVRFDAAAVAEEVKEAQQLEAEMARQVRKELRDQRKEERKAKKEEKKAKLAEDWESFKAKFQN